MPLFYWNKKERKIKVKQTKLSKQQRAILTCTFAHVQESYERHREQGFEDPLLPVSLTKVKESYYSPSEYHKSSPSASFSRSIRRLEQRGLLIKYNLGYVKKLRHDGISLTEEGYKIANILVSGETIEYKKPKSREQEAKRNLKEFLKKRHKRLKGKKDLTVSAQKMVWLWPKTKN